MLLVEPFCGWSTLLLGGVVAKAEIDVPSQGDDVAPEDSELRRDPLEGDKLDGYPHFGGGNGDLDQLLGKLVVQLAPGIVEHGHVDIVDDEEDRRPDHLINSQLDQNHSQAALTGENFVEEDVPPVHHLRAQKSKARYINSISNTFPAQVWPLVPNVSQERTVHFQPINRPCFTIFHLNHQGKKQKGLKYNEKEGKVP